MQGEYQIKWLFKLNLAVEESCSCKAWGCPTGSVSPGWAVDWMPSANAIFHF